MKIFFTCVFTCIFQFLTFLFKSDTRSCRLRSLNVLLFLVASFLVFSSNDAVAVDQPPGWYTSNLTTLDDYCNYYGGSVKSVTGGPLIQGTLTCAYNPPSTDTFQISAIYCPYGLSGSYCRPCPNGYWSSYYGNVCPVPIMGSNNAGAPQNPPRGCSLNQAADPINIAVGNVYEDITDFVGNIGKLPLRIERTYNSRLNVKGIFGNLWSSEFDMQVSSNETFANIRLPSGQTISFTRTSSSDPWVPNSSLAYTLVTNAAGLLLTDNTADPQRIYQFNNAGQLASVANNLGEVQTYQYSAGKLISVTDAFGNVMAFSYDPNSGFLQTISVAGKIYQYGIGPVTGDPFYGSLLSYSYPNANGGNSTIQYKYENTDFPLALTGVVDETGKRVSTWGYDSNGLATFNSRAGIEQFTIDYTHTFDGSGAYTTVTNAKGYAQKNYLQVVNGTSQVVRVDGLGTANCPAATVANSYDASGNVVTSTDAMGNVFLWHYTANHKLDQETQGYTWSGGVNTGNVSNLIESAAMRKWVVTQWDASGVLPLQIQYSGKDYSSGQWVTYLQEDRTYSSTNRIATKTLTDLTNFTVPYASHGRARNWTYTYTYYDQAQSQVQTITELNPSGSTTITYYDANGRKTQESEAVNAGVTLTTTLSNFTSSGLPQVVTDPNGVQSFFVYDTENRVRKVTRNYSSANSAQGQTTTIDYYDNGQLKRTTLADGSWLQYTYSDGIHLTRIDDNAGDYTLLTPSTLDGQWTQRQVFNSGGSLQQIENRTFDDLGKILSILDASGSTTKSSFSYDLNGDLKNSLVGTDSGTAIVRAYDNLRRLTQLNTPDGNHSSYRYDFAGNVAQIIDPRGIVTQYTYDGLGNLMQLQSPDSGITNKIYDAVGNITQKTDARGIVSNYSYDALNRLTAITYPANTVENVSFTYDSTANGNKGIGKLTGYNNDGGATVLMYDAYGNVIQQTDSIGSQIYTTSYQYDNANRVSQITYPSGRVVIYGRNALGQITSIQTKDTATSTAYSVISTVTYQPFGPVASLTYANGVMTTRAVDQDYRISRITTSSTPVWDFVYSYDAASNLLSQTDQASTYSKTFNYDALYRVISDVNNTGTWTYQYDPSGNRTKRVNTSTQTLTYATTSNRMTKNGSTTQTLDAAGNLITNGTKTYAYNNANRLLTYSVSGTVKAQMQYNALGQRTAKLQITQPMHFHYDRSNQLVDTTQYTSAGKLAPRYEFIWLDDMPIAQMKTTYTTTNAVSTRRLTYIHTDHLNTPRVMTDSTNKIVWRWDGDAFGQTAPNQNPDGDSVTDGLNLRFPGQYYDTETGLYYNLNRDYDPTTGRYLHSDPIGLDGGSWSTYAYVNGNPISFIDPFGLRTEVTIWHPVGWGSSSFGHVSTEINGTAYSFGPNGMSVGSSSEYNSKNSFREGTGVLLNLTPEQEAQLAACLAKDQGSYSATSNNCGSPVQSCLKNLGINTGNQMLPVNLGNKLLNLPNNGPVFHPATNPGSGVNAPWAR